MEDKPLVNIVSNSEILNIYYLDGEQNKIIFFPVLIDKNLN